MHSAIRARREQESGFTLIELLVVVIIIGILAAIAIPAFLNQRERAWQAELTSGVRNYALEIEAEATTAGGVYPAAAPAVPAGLDAGGDITFAYTQVGTGTSFTLTGVHALVNAGVNCQLYDSAAGGLAAFSEAACP